MSDFSPPLEMTTRPVKILTPARIRDRNPKGCLLKRKSWQMLKTSATKHGILCSTCISLVMFRFYFSELKQRLYKYFKEGDEEALPSIFEAILQRSLTGKHELTDDELADDLRIQPLDDVDDEDFENDFEDGHKTDEEIDDLYSARDIVTKKMATDEYFNMTDKKWDEMVKEGMEHGFLKDTRECEAILEDMMNWDKLLPDEIKKKVEAKFDEIAARIDTGELTDEQGYALFKEYEDQMVIECTKLMEAEAPKFDETDVHDKKNNLDDPPGEGPILRWQSRCVFAPGGDAWHPKNRLVKLSVTVKELGLSKYQFRRLRELVGKRYDPGRDQLTITSERFEHREENRKDCLRTLYALIEECGKARKLVEEARTSYLKERLRSNPHFMKRLNGKTAKGGELSQ
ncbi:OLC1v1014126C2 [Oldenlandia corymbosa var. corymbosa]|uniref:OLC1v1014126C2 n=2 Tax=Oldenlandia corymbosa var. corymbosa TaxID=529605 RepID=A0AAV1DZZ5_OLDCO|nr:OLC1v1014126C2 [Oldenlandia corymbosa var. corymbosa]